MKAVLLAAGEGVRLQPVTDNRPKHLIRVGGKPLTHLSDLQISTLRKSSRERDE